MGMTIPAFDMHPIEFRLLKTEFRGITWPPAALKSQWLELAEPAAWSLHLAHARSQGHNPASFVLCRE